MKKPIRMEDFEKMEKVEFPQKFMQRTITITKKKEMNISGLFLQQLRADGEQLFLDLRKSQDSRILAFRTVSDDGFEIPKSGKIKHIKFTKNSWKLVMRCRPGIRLNTIRKIISGTDIWKK